MILKKGIVTIALFLFSCCQVYTQIDWATYGLNANMDASVFVPALKMNAFFSGNSVTYVSADGTLSENALASYGGLPNGWQRSSAAVKWDDNTVMLFNGFNYAVFDLNEATITFRGPFPDIPETTEAAVEFGTTQLLFFTGGATFVIYDKENNSVSEPQSLKDYGTWEMASVEAALNPLDGYIYLFGQGAYQKLNITTLKLEGGALPFSSAEAHTANPGGDPPIASNRFSSPPIAVGRPASMPANNNSAIAPITKAPIKKKSASPTLNSDAWCFTGTPKGNSDADLVESVTKLGGGDYNEPYEDTVEQGYRVAEIRVWGSYVILGIQTVLQGTDGSYLELPILGAKKGRTNTFKVPEGDCITGVKGTYDGDYGKFIHSMQILTSGGKSKNFGLPGKRPFSVSIPSGASFYGFSVNHHNYLASIGLKFVGYEDQIPDEEVADNSGATSYGSQYKGEYSDDHEDYIEVLIDAQFGAADGSRLELPAVEWLGKGVDILSLDPLDIGASPTKESPIVLIASRKTGGQEGKKQIPHGTDYKTIGGGSQHEYKEWIESYGDFTTNFGVGMGVSVGTPIGGGSLSGSYRQMNNTKVGSEEVYFTRTIERNLFNLNMDLLWRDRKTGQKKRQKLDFDFREMVDQLPVTAAIPSLDANRMIKGKQLPGSMERIKDAYFQIIQQFGTHLTGNVNFGGKYVAATKIKKSDYESTRMNEFDFKAEVNAQIKAVNIGGNVSFDYKNQSTTGRKSGTLNTNTYVQGGSGETVFETWNTSLSDRPVPIEVQLIPTYQLLTKEFWPNDPNIDKKRRILQLITEKYQVDNGVPPTNSKGDFFRGLGSRKTKYRYVLTVTGIKASGEDDGTGDNADNHEIYGTIFTSFSKNVANKVLPGEIWSKSSDNAIVVLKDSFVAIGKDTEVLLDAGAVGGFFTVSATLSEEDYDIFKETDDRLGTKTKDVYIHDIGNEPKEYSLTGFYGGGTSAEVVFTVRKEPVFN